MPPVTSTTKLHPTIEALKTSASKIKSSPELNDSLEQLNSIVKLLEMSSLGPNIFQRLFSLLRQRLLPLYRTFSALTLQYSAKILTIIHEEKISPIIGTNDESTRKLWEKALTFLLSGVLDFLEEQPTNDNRTIVADAMYPVLCVMRFSQLPSLPLPLGSSALQVIYQLLSETATTHGLNQSKLRNSDYLGSEKIGLLISQTKDYLALEALLELFANLLPSIKTTDGRKKRTEFIREVFSSAMFTCSTEIVRILESISTNGWESTFTKIIDILAKADIAFPQPFEASRFCMPDSKACAINRLYVDKEGFVANLDEGGQLETFQAPYSIIKAIKLSTASSSNTHITLEFFSPPLVGQSPIAKPAKGETLVFFDIHNKDMKVFLKSLDSRGLGDVITQSKRKLSKPEMYLDLNFAEERKDVSTQEKVQSIQRLWSSTTSQADGLLPTSPFIHETLAAQLLRDVSRMGSPATKDLPIDPLRSPISKCSKSSLQLDTSPPLSQPKNTNSGIGASIVLDSDDEHSVPTRKAKTIKKIMVSDDEESTFKETKITSPIVVDHLGAESKTKTKTKTTEGKRSAGENTDPRVKNSEVDHRSTDRPRRTAVHEDDTKPKISRQVPAPRRYGRKGRTSSPVSQTTEVDFDKLPAPLTDHHKQSDFETRNPKDRISGTKSKGEKIAHKVEPTLATNKSKKRAAPPEMILPIKNNVEDTNKTPRPSGSDNNYLKPQDIGANQVVKPSRRSARVAKINAGSNATGLNPNANTGTKADLQVVSKTPRSDHLVEGVLQNKSQTVSKGEESFVEAVVASSEDARISTTNEILEDFIIDKDHYEPLKIDTTPPDFDMPENEIVMIDLTSDSPQPGTALKVNDYPTDITSPVHIPIHYPRVLPSKLPITSSPSPKNRPHFSFMPSRSSYDDSLYAKPNYQLCTSPRKQIIPAVRSPLVDLRRTSGRQAFEDKANNYDDHLRRAKKSRVDPTARIIDTIGEITQVIVNNASRRFDNVRKDLRAGQASILLETAHDLEEMHIESVGHFNAFVDLEEEYANHRRRIIDGLETLCKINQDMSHFLTETIQKHDRNSLSKKFPNKLFSSPLPAIISNPDFMQ